MAMGAAPAIEGVSNFDTNAMMNQKLIATFEDAFPNYVKFNMLIYVQHGPKKVFGILKKRQEGGLGIIMQRYVTKLVDLNLSTGIFQYVSKDGGKMTSFAFRVNKF